MVSAHAPPASKLAFEGVGQQLHWGLCPAPPTLVKPPALAHLLHFDACNPGITFTRQPAQVWPGASAFFQSCRATEGGGGRGSVQPQELRV